MDKIDILMNKLSAQYDEEFFILGITPSVDQFNDMANRVRSQITLTYTDAEFENAKNLVQENRSVQNGVAIFIEKKSADHELWYTKRYDANCGKYNKRYLKFLQQAKHWSEDTVRKLDSNTDKIMDRIGDPQKESPWKRKGLIIGEVQSGKTANYTSICNKAVDAGYKVIIVLAGLTNSLRRQTQQRLENDFVGLHRPGQQSVSGELIATRLVGVASYGKVDYPVEVFTSTERDFSKAVADTTSVSFNNNSVPRLFVLKKNKSVLTNLEVWLRDITGGNKIDVPMLIIDDESDNASVNTKTEDAPSAINACIRNILRLFSRSTYLGVTATPFANIFINPFINSVSNNADGDLFPEDFISYIEPPSSYIGSDKMFRDSEYSNMIIPVYEEEVKDTFYFKHKKDVEIRDIPIGLKKAIRYFILTNCIRDYLGQSLSHRSMMINVSRFVDVQNRLKDKVQLFWNKIMRNVYSYAKMGDEGLKNTEIVELKKIWDEYNLEKIAKAKWELLQPMLYDSNYKVNIWSINQKSTDKLDYPGYLKKNGEYLRVIAIGGDCLSRGITLEDLCVTYFYRNSKMYDTLMQMGRWFGYRPGYHRLVKVWMAEEAIEWYNHISEVTEELIIEIYRMNRNELTPMDFGIKIKGHPDALIPTAAVKMKNAEKELGLLEVSVDGHLIESPRLYDNVIKMKQNEDSVKTFIKTISTKYSCEFKGNDLFWTGIPSTDVAALVRTFKASVWHQYFMSKDLADCIQSDYEPWDVYIKNGDPDNQDYELELSSGLKKMHCQKRGNTIIAGVNNRIVKVSGTHVKVGWGGCTSVTLEPQEKKKLDEQYRLCATSKRKDGTFKETPDNYYLHGVKHPILFIHFLDLKYKGDENVYEDGRLVVALGLGFPSDEDYDQTIEKKKKRKTIPIYLNTIAQRLKEEEGDDANND